MKKAIFLLSLVAFVACETELDTIETPINDSVQTTENTNNLITAEEAAAQALEFRQSLMAESGITRSAGKDKGVASVYAWRTSKVLSKAPTRSSLANILPDTLLYIVNFEQNSGYALVSATKEVPGVVAYIDNGGLTPDQPIDNPGFSEFLENYGENYARFRDSTKNWNLDSMFVIDLKSKVASCYPYNTGLDSVIQSDFDDEAVYVKPLLNTKWGQSDPYNNQCPILDPKNNSHRLAGCVAVAIGQVLAYYQWPESYNNHIYDWTSMLRYERIPDSDAVASQNVATLLADIGSMVSMSYQDVSKAQFDSIQYCLNDLGYNYFYVKDKDDIPFNGTDFDTIMNDICNHHPVIIMGSPNIYTSSGHAWVIDGVMSKRSVTNIWRLTESGYNYPYLRITYHQYVHCNWGNYGICDGWFKFGSFQKMWDINTNQEMTDVFAQMCETSCNFNYKNYAYHEIYPNQ